MGRAKLQKLKESFTQKFTQHVFTSVVSDHETLKSLLAICYRLNCEFAFSLHMIKRANYGKIEMDVVATMDFY